MNDKYPESYTNVSTHDYAKPDETKHDSEQNKGFAIGDCVIVDDDFNHLLSNVINIAGKIGFISEFIDDVSCKVKFYNYICRSGGPNAEYVKIPYDKLRNAKTKNESQNVAPAHDYEDR